MTEKINGQGFRPTDTAATRRSEAATTPTQGRGAAPSDKAAPTGDTVNITQSGLLMSKLEEIVQRTPVVDSARVAELKQQIAAGTYEINDQRIADQILKFERDVLG